MASPSPSGWGAVPAASGGPERRPNTQRPIHRADPYAASLLGRLASKLASSVSSFFSSAPARKASPQGTSISSSPSVRIRPVLCASPSPTLWGSSAALSADREVSGSERTGARPSASGRGPLVEALDPSLWPRDNISFPSTLAAPTRELSRQGPACLPGYDPVAESHDALSIPRGSSQYVGSSPQELADRPEAQWQRMDALPPSTNASPGGDLQMGWQPQGTGQTDRVPPEPLFDGVSGRQHFPAGAGDSLRSLEASSRFSQQQWLLQQGAWGPQPAVDGTLLPAPTHGGYPLRSVDRPAPASARALAGYSIPGEPLTHPAYLRPSLNGHRARFTAAAHSLNTEARVAGSLDSSGPIRRRGSEARPTQPTGPPVPVLRLHPTRNSRSHPTSWLRQEEHLTVDQLQRLYLRCQPLRWRVRLRELFRQEVESAGAVGIVAEEVPSGRGPPVGHKVAHERQVDSEGVGSLQDDVRRVDGSVGSGTSPGRDRASGSSFEMREETVTAGAQVSRRSAAGAPDRKKIGEDAGANEHGETDGIPLSKGGLFASLSQLDAKQSVVSERRGAFLETNRDMPSTGLGRSVGAASTTLQRSLLSDHRCGDSGAQSLFGSTAVREGDGLSTGGVTTNTKGSSQEPAAAFSLASAGGGAGGASTLFAGREATDKEAAQGRLDPEHRTSATGGGGALARDQTSAALQASPGTSGPAAGLLFQASSSLLPTSQAAAGDVSGEKPSGASGSSLFSAPKGGNGGEGETAPPTTQSSAKSAAFAQPATTSLFGGGSSFSGGSSLFGKTPDREVTGNKDSQILPTFGRLASSLASDSTSETATKGASLFGGVSALSAVSNLSGADSKSATAPSRREPAEKPHEPSSGKEGTPTDIEGVGKTASSTANTASEGDAKPQDKGAAEGQASQSEASAVPWWQQNVGKACLVQVEDDGFAPDADDDADEKETGSAAGGGAGATRHTFATPVSGGSLFGSSATESKPPTTTSSLFGTYSSVASTTASSSTSGAGGGLFGATTSGLFGKTSSSLGAFGTGTQSQAASSAAPPSLFVFGGGQKTGEAGKQSSGSASGATASGGGPSGSLFGSSVSAPAAGAASGSSAEREKSTTGNLFVFGGSAATTGSGTAGEATAAKAPGTGLFVFGSSGGVSQSASSNSSGSTKRGREGGDAGAPAAKSVFGGATVPGASTTGSLFGMSSVPSLFGGTASAGTGGGSTSSSLFALGASASGAKETAGKEAGSAALGAAGASPFGDRSSTPVFGGTGTAAGSTSSLSTVFGESKAEGNTGNPFQLGKAPAGKTLGAGTGSLFGNTGGTSSTGTSLFGASLGAPGGGVSGSLFGSGTGGAESQRSSAAPVASSSFGSQSVSNGGSSGSTSLFGSAVASRPFTFGASAAGGDAQGSTGAAGASVAGSTGLFGVGTGAAAQGHSAEDGSSLFGPQAGGPVVRRPRLTIKRTKK
ncbi:Proteophosphoglycan 5, related [Neospora caninum Liverpool]|uniref:Proteophosphoglycan 5, related n=1 Tax=Neospora caninum (strain Liverpool) TaxID=572307 RepID=F0VF47_NEOCL|nr:Proteophosphoglycan 5, related [Neospora caninum Liverpool]CBZ52341.1 Proteophosphoglycan 5, related [Neospora caninum Liverpool]CEL66310.1 TPA: Proteophosphoglycan 5, related [Neospora caninum Liverpool]|eukprot:XP_003882373.1 Proteophosphoglycan 5, related [Neospora caninum Liverpool]